MGLTSESRPSVWRVWRGACIISVPLGLFCGRRLLVSMSAHFVSRDRCLLHHGRGPPRCGFISRFRRCCRGSMLGPPQSRRLKRSLTCTVSSWQEHQILRLAGRVAFLVEREARRDLSRASGQDFVRRKVRRLVRTLSASVVVCGARNPLSRIRNGSPCRWPPRHRAQTAFHAKLVEPLVLLTSGTCRVSM